MNERNLVDSLKEAFKEAIEETQFDIHLRENRNASVNSVRQNFDNDAYIEIPVNVAVTDYEIKFFGNCLHFLNVPVNVNVKIGRREASPYEVKNPCRIKRNFETLYLSWNKIHPTEKLKIWLGQGVEIQDIYVKNTKQFDQLYFYDTPTGGAVGLTTLTKLYVAKYKEVRILMGSDVECSLWIAWSHNGLDYNISNYLGINARPDHDGVNSFVLPVMQEYIGLYFMKSPPGVWQSWLQVSMIGIE